MLRASEVQALSGQKSVEGEASSSSEAFSEAYGRFWEVPIFFSSAVGHDLRINPTFRAIIVYRLGAIEGINEMLLDSDIFSPAESVINKPENVEQYVKIMSKLEALYESYRASKRLNAVNLVENIEQIVIDLLDFAKEIMEESKAGRC